jgi:heme exporter protein D
MPDWPTPPVGWRWWRPRRDFAIRTAGTAVGFTLAALVVLCLASGAAKHRGDQYAYQARKDRGVITTATIVSSHYDANGGDPAGWTRQVVVIPTPSGPVRAVVGHHGENQGDGATVAVIYDPMNPTNAQTVQDFHDFGDYAVFGSTASMMIATALYVLAALGFSVALSIPVRYLRARHRQRHQLRLRYGQP